MESDSSIYDESFIYQVGKVVETNYCSNINEVCGEGLHYFKTYDAALSWYYRNNTSQRIDGQDIWYYENGQVKYEMNYKDRKLDGKYIRYYKNGQVGYERKYKD